MAVNEQVAGFLDTCWLASQTHRPLLIVGNGPSNVMFDPRRIPPNPVIFRINMFMLEPNYAFGSRADAVFWAIYRRVLQVGLEVSQTQGFYDIGSFFYPPYLQGQSLPLYLENTNRQIQTFQPHFWHWDVFRHYPTFDEYFFNRTHGGLPTSGTHALAMGLILGFKDVYVTGLDFYQVSPKLERSARERHFYDDPDYLKPLIAKVHKDIGYESRSHSENIDKSFFRTLCSTFSDARIYCAVPESPMADLAPVAPVLEQHFVPEMPRGEKDIERFHTLYREALYDKKGQLGEVKWDYPAMLSGWAWDTDKQLQSSEVEVVGDNGTVITSGPASEYMDELDKGSVGEATHGFNINLYNYPQVARQSQLTVRFKDGAELPGSPFRVPESFRRYFNPRARVASRRRPITIVCHHPRSMTVSVGLSVHNVFTRQDSFFTNVDYIWTLASPSTVDRQVDAAIAAGSAVVVNGLFAFRVNDYAGFHAVSRMADAGLPIFVYWHETSWKTEELIRGNPGRWEGMKELFRRPNVQHWVASSQNKQFLMSFLGARFEKVRVVYEAIALADELPPKPRVSDHISLLTAAETTMRKGFDMFIDMSNRLKDIDGRPVYFRWHNSDYADIENLGVKDIDRFQLAGWTSSLAEATRAADAVLMTSRDDPQPITPLLALACDIPAFCFDSAGTAEHLPAEFVAHSVEDMIAKVERWWRNRDQYPPGFFRNLVATLDDAGFRSRVSIDLFGENFQGTAAVWPGARFSLDPEAYRRELLVRTLTTQDGTYAREQLHVEIEAVCEPELSAGKERQIRVLLRNAGTRTVPACLHGIDLMLAWRWIVDGADIVKMGSMPIPHDLPPQQGGELTVLSATVTPPNITGTVILEFGLMLSTGFWIGQEKKISMELL